MLWRLRRTTVGVTPILLLVIGLLTPMAYASPPDPSWIKGIYDGADFDDVVVLVTLGVGVVELAPVVELSPLPPGIWLAQLPDGSTPAHSSSPLHSRSPPSL